VSLKQRIRALLERHDARAKKSFGQNFLIDERILEQIADLAVEGAKTVIEIGPGPGTLTSALLERGVDVIAVEKDRAMIEILQHELASARFHLVEGDVLDVRFADLSPDRPHVAGNIPYNISAPILIQLLEQRRAIGPATLMLQKEVADRISSPPGSKAYGSLSVMLQMFADVSKRIRVPPGAFSPPPKVDSTVVRLEWLSTPRAPIADEAHFERVVRAAFSQRRKMLRNSLRTVFDPEQIARAANASGLAFDRRAESLSLEEFARLASALDALG
jgi:16S rRNA (adenine1518-N6/adenine1519-N6)-dimethyltransferase